MTNDQMQSIRDDLAFMRALAEEGRRAPLLGGSILALAGTVFPIGALAHWAHMRGWLGEDPWLLSAIWLAAVAVFLAGLVVSKRRLQTRPGANAPANRAMGAVWAGLGGAIFTLWVAFMIASATSGEWIIMTLFGPVILAIYGAAWTVAAAMSDRVWIKGTAVLSFVGAVGVAALAESPDQFLAYAVALVLTALLPGLALMRQAPAEIV